MGIITRSVADEFPGSPTLIEDPFDCTNFATMQALAKELQAGSIESGSATIVGGRIYASPTKAQIETACEAI